MTTMKSEIVMASRIKIISLSMHYIVRIHNFRIRKQEKFLPKSSIKYADSGYQEWQKLQSNVVLSYKKHRKHSLISE